MDLLRKHRIEIIRQTARDLGEGQGYSVDAIIDQCLQQLGVPFLSGGEPDTPVNCIDRLATGMIHSASGLARRN